jgi:hypothetical protein
MEINDNTPIAMLTVGQLKEVLNLEVKEEVITKDFTDKKYVYGLKGIREIFKVSHATAQKYKDSFLKNAISQQGRKIIVDVEKAYELFHQDQSL